MLCAFFLAQGTTRVLAAELLAPNLGNHGSGKRQSRSFSPNWR